MNLLQNINGLIDRFQPSSDLIEKLSVGQFEGKRHCRLSIVAGLFLAMMIIIIFLIRGYLEGIVSVLLIALPLRGKSITNIDNETREKIRRDEGINHVNI